ncbi:MAG: ABC transporter permease [Candidatus ainarchaeum sp.]|nr:ABC transporter permease [Candidatus ainarchaeum sp.]
MKLKDILSLALNSIRHRSLRSWLTILGIVIGMASIVTLIGISMGISESINERMTALGSNIITVSAGGMRAFGAGGGFGVIGAGGGFEGAAPPGRERGEQTAKITFREADDLRTLPGVYKLDARVEARKTVKYKDKNSSLTIVGTQPLAFQDSVGVDMLYGRYLSTSDQHSAVVGFRVANATFNDLSMLNKEIKIDGNSFRVVGILAESGSGSTDTTVFIPQAVARSMFNLTSATSAVSQVVIVANSGYDTDTVAGTVESRLITLHHVTEQTEDFQVMTAAKMQSTVSSVSDTLTMLLGGIASISLLVGGIGVANTMFMSVLEQTKDIGVLKSLGAKNRDVTALFLSEAAIIGFVGGLLGVLLSFAASAVLGSFNVPTSISAELIIGTLLFSILIGVVAGVFPARSAEAIPPVEALRYE